MFRIALASVLLLGFMAFGSSLEAASRGSSCPGGNCPYNANSATTSAAWSSYSAGPTQPVSFVTVVASAPVDASREMLEQINLTRAFRGQALLACPQSAAAALTQRKVVVERSTATQYASTSARTTVKTSSAQNAGPVRRWFSWLFH